MKKFILVILLLGTSEQLQQIKHRIFNQSINSFSKFLFSKSFSILLEIRQIFYHWHDLITDFWKAFFLIGSLFLTAAWEIHSKSSTFLIIEPLKNPPKIRYLKKKKSYFSNIFWLWQMGVQIKIQLVCANFPDGNPMFERQNRWGKPMSCPKKSQDVEFQSFWTLITNNLIV